MLRLKLVSLLLDVLYILCRVPYYTEIYRDERGEYNISLQHRNTQVRPLWLDIDECEPESVINILNYIRQISPNYDLWTTFSYGYHLVTDCEFDKSEIRKFADDLIHIGLHEDHIRFVAEIDNDFTQGRFYQGQRISLKHPLKDHDLKIQGTLWRKRPFKSWLIIGSIYFCKLFS